MKLIEGSTLADLLARRPDPAHDLPGFLKTFEQIAQTVAFAHSRGVLHRDLKPHNVMVGAFGEVQVMDWGLAKDLASRDREGAGDPNPAPSRSRLVTDASDRTRAGTAVGTPAYMAPEQARGEIDRLDTRADVFGLGAILCEILTGRPPFTGYDPLAQSRRADLTDAHQRLDRATCDPELVALARRCLDADPANRPADGRAVADGITGHLAGVQERLRQTELAGAKATAERRRRRAVRGLGALAAGLLVAGLGAVVAVQTRANANLKQTNDDLTAANDRERQRFNLALDAIDLFHGDAIQDLILREAQLKPLRTKLLHGVADFYTRLDGQFAGQDDPASQAALVRGYTQIGWLHVSLDDLPAAVTTWRKALAVQQRLATAPGADRETRLGVAGTLMHIGRHQKEFDPAAATITLGEAQAVAAAVERESGETSESRFLVAQISVSRADHLLYGESKRAEASRLYEEALSIYESLHRNDPRNPKLLNSLGWVHTQIAQCVSTTAESRRHGRQALGYYQSLLELDTISPDYRHALANCYMTLSWTNRSADVPLEETIAAAEEGRRLAANLVTEFPIVAAHERVLVLCLFHASQQYLLLDRAAEARAALETALRHAEHLAATGDAGHLRQLALFRAHLASIDLADGNPDAALRGCRQAEREMEEAIRRVPTPVHKSGLGLIVRRLGLVHLSAGRLAEAAVETRRARNLITQYEKSVTNARASQRVVLAACHAVLAGLAGKPGSGVPAADAETEADRAMELLNTNTSNYYPHPRFLTSDPAFASLRDRKDFQDFIRQGERLVEKAKTDAGR
jgi:tetratricopeptide (TPR) repeat protein